MWYNMGNKILFGSSGAGNTLEPELHLSGRRAMNSISSCPHYVYELVDPRDNSIFYVGITVNLYRRYQQHMCCDGTNVQKDMKIQEILDAGFLPIMRTIERVDTFEQGIEREGYWIRHYLDSGIPLLNVSIAAKHQSRETQAGRQSKAQDTYDLMVYRVTYKKWPAHLSPYMRWYYNHHYMKKTGKYHSLVERIREQAKR